MAIHIQVTDQHPILIIEEIILFIARTSPQPLHAQPHTQPFVRIADGYELRYCPRLCIRQGLPFNKAGRVHFKHDFLHFFLLCKREHRAYVGFQ